MNIESLLSLFLLLFLFFIIILIYKKYNYKQFHWIFILFMFLYNVFTALNFLKIKPDFVNITFNLSYREDLIALQLLISSLCILTYGILLLFFKNEIVVNHERNNSKNYVINIKYLYLILYPITIYLVINFPWPAYGDDISLSFGNSLAAYFKNVELVLLIIIFVNYKKINKLLYLMSFIIIIVIDTQRTPLFIALMAYLLLADDSKALKYSFLAILGILILAIVAMFRSGIDVSLVNMLFPFYYEGIFGSYCVLQSFEIIHLYNFDLDTHLKLFFSPGIDLLIKFLPSVYFDILDYRKDEFYIFSEFTSQSLALGILQERWSPIGGFFYIAESNLIVPYLGPVIFTILFFFAIRKITFIKDPVLKIIIYTNLFAYIKANFMTASNFLLFLLIVYYGINFINFIAKQLIQNQFKKGMAINENTN